MIKKGTYRHINMIPSNPSVYEIQKNCSLLNYSSPLETTINVTEKYLQKKQQKPFFTLRLGERPGERLQEPENRTEY